MYYRERQVAQSLGCTWVLGNPGILRRGGGGGGRGTCVSILGSILGY